LDESEIEQMRKDAEANAEEDRRQFELAEARNKASQMTYQCEKLMTDNADKLTDADKEPMNKAIEKVKTAAATERCVGDQTGDRRAQFGLAGLQQGAVRTGERFASADGGSKPCGGRRR
jgi:molecular chaperone DnaK